MSRSRSTRRWLALLLLPVLALALTTAAKGGGGPHLSAPPTPSVSETLVSPSASHFPQNKQNESPMAVNPVDPSNAITGANDEIEEPDCTPATDGSSSCPFASGVDLSGVYWTTDGGSSWSQQILHWYGKIGLTSDGDPVVAFGPQPNGNGGFSYDSGARAYFGSLAGNPAVPSQELLAVDTSDDKGGTWNGPVVATTRDNPVDFNDKISLWVDNNPASPYFGNVYVGWTLFQGVGMTNWPEPIMVSRSTDGGATFSKPVKITPAYNNNSVGGRQGSQIRTDSKGNVYVFWESGTSSHQDYQQFAVSTNGGASFGRPRNIALVNDLPYPSFPGASFRINSFPSVDVGPSDALYATWADSTAGHAVVKLAKSTDYGRTWSTSTVADVTGRSAFYPAVAAAANGKVFIGFNAIDDKPVGTAPGAGVVSYDAYYVLSTNGGGSWSSPVKISAAPSDPDASSANNLAVQFIGDYNGAAAGSDGAFWFSWTDSRNGSACSAVDDYRAGTGPRPNIYDSCDPTFGNTDIYVAKVGP